MTNFNISIAVFMIAALFAAMPSTVQADGWELRTAEQAVPGTREIEQGKIARAIEISKVRLPHASAQNKVAFLTNLCVAYILTREFNEADDYCSQAVKRPNEQAVTYNNRGVLRAMQGDVEAAMQDFAKASTSGCVGKCSDSAKAPRDLPRPLARRNFDKAQYLVQQSKSSGDETVATSND